MWFDHFQRVEIPWSETELLIVVDHDDQEFCSIVQDAMWSWVPYVNGITIKTTNNKVLGEYDSVGKRRKRIASHWDWFLSTSSGSYLLGAEDDTLPAYDAYVNLLDVAFENNADFVQGTIIGRWSSRSFPHWKVIRQSGNVPTAIQSGCTESLVSDVIEIDGGGWYCFVAKADTFRGKPLEFSQDGPLGPDVMWVWNAKTRGATAYGVWSVGCEHLCESSSISPYHKYPQKLTAVYSSEGWNYTSQMIPSLRNYAEGSGSKQEGNGMSSVTKVLFQANRSIRVEGEMLFTGARKWLDPLKARQLVSRGSGTIVEMDPTPVTVTEVKINPEVAEPLFTPESSVKAPSKRSKKEKAPVVETTTIEALKDAEAPFSLDLDVTDTGDDSEDGKKTTKKAK